MESLEVSAKTVNEAIQQALATLGKNREEVDISILSEGSRGILGIGSEDARILVSVRAPAEEQAETGKAAPVARDVASVAKEVLEKLMASLRIQGRVNVITSSASPASDGSDITLDIEGGDLGVLIGRRGENLSSLQFILNLIVSKQLHKRTRVTVDVSGYRVRRQEMLKGLALRMAERVQTTRQPIALEAMPAYERRIIHIALSQHPGATTQSIGEGEDRKVVIVPRK
ncbi:MAG: protein jag [Chloroflexi bacterium]|nr:protein jag [Chloroflexota bacterium]MDA8189092.1 protein jag [Dehalococcoidales bacterium]